MPAGLRYGIEVRAAQSADAAELARLLTVGGVPASTHDMAGRLEAVRTDPQCAVLVATGYAGLSGLIALCWAPVLHAPRPIARITLLIVDVEERRRGIGRLLMKAASQAARSAGCETMELAIPLDRDAADAFCQNAGFSLLGRLYGRNLRRR